MNKKIGVSILIGVLVLISVVVITKFASGDTFNIATSSAIAVYGYPDYDNATKGGQSEIVNLTVVYTGTTGEFNISNITIAWSGNYTFQGWVGVIDTDDSYMGACTAAADECNLENITFGNVTIMNGAVGDWNCLNLTNTMLNCMNNSAASELGPGNTSIIIRFNVSANTGVEDRNMWNITVSEASENGGNTTELDLYTYVDGLAPRLVELNVSDGNMTYRNGTFNGTNGGSGIYTYLDANSNLIITATLYEQTVGADNRMKLYYNATNASELITTLELYTDLSTNHSTILNPDSCVHDSLRAVDDGYTHPVKCIWTIPPYAAINGGGEDSETVAFGFYVNDSFENAITINDSSPIGTVDSPFGILTNGTLPYVKAINVSDQYEYSLTTLDGSGYLNGQITVRVEVSGGPRAGTSNSTNDEVNGWARLYYNMTGPLTLGTNGFVEDYDSFINLTTGSFNITTTENASNLRDPSYTSFYSAAFTDEAAGDGNTSGVDTAQLVYLAVVIGGNSTNFYIADNSGDKAGDEFDNLNGNYTTIAGQYSFKIDTKAPDDITVTRISSAPGVNQYDSTGVEYKCTADDRGSGIQKYVWTLDKPGDGVDVTTTVTVGNADATNYDIIVYKETNLDVVGNYIVKCKVYDNVDNYEEKITSGEDGFTVSSSANVAGGAGGPGGAAAVVTFDVDFTTANEGTLKAQQGRVKSFSFDGVTKHTLTFMEVTASSATLKIESTTPTVITLNAKETKDVDVNGDGVNDMSIKLNSIVNGVADITVKKVEEGAAKIVKEEETARGITEETPVTPVEGKGMTWLWVLIAVIVIAVLGYYFFNKKK